MSFFRNILDAVSDNLISGDAYYLIIKGIIVTAVIAILAWIIALVVGSLISFVCCYEKKVVSSIGRVLSFVFRSTPVLLGMMFFYYVFFKSSHISGTLIMAIALGLYGAGHFGEIITRAVLVEQSGLTSATREKLGHMFFTTVVPQAMEDSVFQIKRLVIQIFQWTTIAGYISVNDLTEVMSGIGQRTMYPFFSIAFSIILYWLATLVIELIFKLIMDKIKKSLQ